MRYKIELTAQARKFLSKIKNPVIIEQIAATIDLLATNPHQQGKQLKGILNQYRSIKSARQRYRIIYKIEEEKVLVVIIAIGLRRSQDRNDIYQTLQRFIRGEKK